MQFSFKRTEKSFHKVEQNVQSGKVMFYVLVIIAFVTILIFNALTPYLSDDLIYKIDVNRANSILDLVKQQYSEYLSNSGRIIGQFNIRLSLIGSKTIFNIVNSVMFIALTLLIYVNISGRKKYDNLLYILIAGMLWRYAVEFDQTILWLCGACNYLWGSVIILGFITYYRYCLKRSADNNPKVLSTVLCFFYGIIAGWCNENTSGGGLLLIIMFTVPVCIERYRQKDKVILPFMAAAHAGMACGLMGMVLSPGVVKRAAAMSDNYTGLLAYLSRFYKCTMTIGELFFELLVIFIVVTVLVFVQGKIRNRNCVAAGSFFIAAIATAYALILTPPPMDRAYFGAGIFLIIACLQNFVLAFYGIEKNNLYAAGRYIAVSVLSLWLFFTYIDNLVNLGRIYREENERIELIQEANVNGEGVVVVPQYRPAFANPYSNAHASDMTDDPKYWINHFYEEYYKVGTIIAIPREEWNELYKD